MRKPPAFALIFNCAASCEDSRSDWGAFEPRQNPTPRSKVQGLGFRDQNLQPETSVSHLTQLCWLSIPISRFPVASGSDPGVSFAAAAVSAGGDNGKQNGNYRDYRDSIRVILGLYRDTGKVQGLGFMECKRRWKLLSKV